MRVPILVFLGTLGLASTAHAQTATAPAAGTATRAARHYAVTLFSSFEPIPDRLVPSDLTGMRVYRAQNTVFGKTIYFVRAGFFATSADAETARGRLAARYPGLFVSEIDAGEYARVAVNGRKPGAPTAAAEPVPAARADFYVVTLDRRKDRAPKPAGPLPAALRANRLYTRSGTGNGQALHTLNLGFFTRAADAERARRLLLAAYPTAQVRPATREERDQSARSVVTAPRGTVVRIAATPVAASAGVEKQAAALLDQARNALTRGDNSAAVRLLNQVLQLPPNSQSQDAQELIGLAHERNGELRDARNEYKLYLKLYPEGEGAERVRQRLANLEAPTVRTPTLKAAKRRKDVNVTTAYGSWSQYYYRGDTRAETTTTTVGPTVDQATLTMLDQSSLINSLDLTGRVRSGDWDHRVVVRDSYTVNFLENTENLNRLYAAYVESKNKLHEYSARLGRQPGNSGGVLGRFDGIAAGYNFLPKWRLNLVGGEPVEFNPIDSDKLFWGANLDFGTFAEHWNGNLYYVYQTVDEITDREAAGLELRYFSPRASLLLLGDYDTTFDELNVVLFQGTWQIPGGTTINVLGDHRRAPVLQTSNAVIGETNTSVGSLLQTMTEDQIRAQALDRTPIADLIMLGVNHSFNSTWQLGGDVKLYNISSTPASGALPYSPGTGNVYVYTVQGIATALLTRRDISVLSLSYIDSRSYDGWSAALSNRTILRDRWTSDLSLRYYRQTDSLGVELTRLTPTVRVGYRWRDRISLEGEIGIEQSETVNGMTTEDTTRRFYMLGYRWDF